MQTEWSRVPGGFAQAFNVVRQVVQRGESSGQRVVVPVSAEIGQLEPISDLQGGEVACHELASPRRRIDVHRLRLAAGLCFLLAAGGRHDHGPRSVIRAVVQVSGGR